MPAASAARQLFAAHLRRERLRQGLSQEQLAERAGVHRTYLGSVERGERNVSIDNIWAIAQALRVPMADLLAEEPSAYRRHR